MSEAATPTTEAFAWDVIAQIAELLRPAADTGSEPIMSAFALAEDALAERRPAQVAPTGCLRWDTREVGAIGYAGCLAVAMVGPCGGGLHAPRIAGERPRFFWQVTAIYTRRGRAGTARSLTRARRAAEKAWSAWTAEAGLAPRAAP